MSWEDNMIDMIVTCDICDIEISTCYRCRNCHSRWCLDCKGPTTYDCMGGNHHFSEECCDNCVPEYGRIVNDEYFCPNCAPETSTLEYKFKRAVYRFQDKITSKYNRSRGLSIKYLNNPLNWTRDIIELEEEWTEMMILKTNKLE